MRLEEITKQLLADLPDDNLHAIRARALQLWKKYFQGKTTDKAAGLERSTILEKYGILYETMDAKGLIANPTELDLEVAKRRMYGMDIAQFAPLVLVPGVISVIGKFVSEPMNASEVDFRINDFGVNVADVIEKVEKHAAQSITSLGKIAKQIKGQLDNEQSIPLFDLALVPRMSPDRTTPIKKDGPRLFSENERCEILSVLRHIETNGTVLDVGCSDGMFLELLFKNGIAAKGVDRDDAAVSACTAIGLDATKHTPGNPLPYDTGSFDYVTSVHYLEKMDDPTAIIDETIRVATKKAIFIVNTTGDHSDIIEMFSKSVPNNKTENGGAIGMQTIPIPGLQDCAVVVLDVQVIKTTLKPQQEQISKKKLFIKKDHVDEQIVVGVVYEPNVDDAHGDWTTPEEIVNAAHSFMEQEQTFGINHETNTLVSGLADNPIAKVLESYIAPADFRMVCSDGTVREVKKGSWVLSAKVLCSETWQKIKDGTITGFSMAGTSLVKET